MKIIFGLGNPGLRYAATRHNCGFLTLDQLAHDLGCSFSSRERQGNLLAESAYRGQKLILAKPQAYMNLSGFPLIRLCAYYKVPYTDMLVICDDLNLAPGQLRLRARGSDGGHKGLQSIIAQTGGSDFCRLRIGIGSAPYDAAGHVISPFAEEEMPLMAAAFARAAEAALCWAEQGIQTAMNRYNVQPRAEEEPENQD